LPRPRPPQRSPSTSASPPPRPRKCVCLPSRCRPEPRLRLGRSPPRRHHRRCLPEETDPHSGRTPGRPEMGAVLTVIGVVLNLAGALWLLVGFSPKNKRYTEGVTWTGASPPIQNLLRDQGRSPAWSWPARPSSSLSSSTDPLYTELVAAGVRIEPKSSAGSSPSGESTTGSPRRRGRSRNDAN
jgi:hypothetical protein